MKLLTTTVLALCMLIVVGCAEGNAPSPDAAATISNATNKVQANISGMDCSGCSSSVVAALEAIQGVTAASADVASGDVKVALADDADVDAAKMEISKVISELQDGKYAVKTMAILHGNPTVEKICPAECTKDCCKKSEIEEVIDTVKEEVNDVTKDIEIPSIGGQ